MEMMGKTTNALMKHVRNSHRMDIEGSKHKRERIKRGA